MENGKQNMPQQNENKYKNVHFFKPKPKPKKTRIHQRKKMLQ